MLYRFGGCTPCLSLNATTCYFPPEDPSCMLLRPAIWHLAVGMGMGACALPTRAAITRGKRKRKRIQKHKHMQTPANRRVI